MEIDFKVSSEDLLDDIKMQNKLIEMFKLELQILHVPDGDKIKLLIENDVIDILVTIPCATNDEMVQMENLFGVKFTRSKIFK